MKYFLDTEFIEAPGVLDLISIGIVADDGRELYWESREVDWSRASAWVIENVKPNLGHIPAPKATQHGVYFPIDRKYIAEDIARFVGDDPEPEFWGYYADYDWVVFCWLFGSMIDLPKGWPMYCRDIKQMMDYLGVAREQLPANDAHHALIDARWIRAAHAAISDVYPKSPGS